MNASAGFGFRFWLTWILWFAGSLTLAALVWTVALTGIFHRIEGPELTMVWAVAVFGSWFLLVVPFMRKKEQIWKRLNQDEERAADAWLAAMALFIGLLIVSSLGWSFVYRRSLGTFSTRGLNSDWAKAVFGTWIFLLLPFLVWMYRKADQIFKAAVIRQKVTGPVFRTLFVEKSKRLLPEKIAKTIQAVPPMLPKGHVVTLRLKDGTQVPHVFVLNSCEILGVYDRQEWGFEARDVVAVEVAGETLPAYEESKWLRLDGRA